MKKVFLIFILLPWTVWAETFAERQAVVARLEDEILRLQTELSKCRTDKTLWTTATVVGGVGTVATGVGAVVQAVKLKKLKQDGKVESDGVDADKVIE